MPKVRTKNKRVPEGFDLLEPTLNEFEQQMREAEADPGDGKRKVERMWPIIKINHKRSRYIYKLFYEDRAISRELYEWLLREKYADAALIAMWKKPGYEYLCCLQCVDKSGTNFGTTCICRVPSEQLDPDVFVECPNSGCHGCASSNFSRRDKTAKKSQSRGSGLVHGYGGEEDGEDAQDVADTAFQARLAALRGDRLNAPS